MKYNDIILKNNNKFKISSSKNKVKISKTKLVLLNIKSHLYGDSYIYLLPNEFNKLMKIKNVKLSYNFLDGELVDNDKFYESDIWVKNTYYYDTGRELCEKLEEISMIEYVLNDTFWVFDSFYSFIFTNYKIKFEMNNKKYKFNSVSDFYSFLFSKSMHKNKSKDFVLFYNNKYKFLKDKYILDKKLYKDLFKKYKDFKILSKLDTDSFVEVDKNFFLDIKSIKGDCRLFINEVYENYSSYISDTYLQNTINYTYNKPNIIELYIQAIAPLVIDELDSSHTEYMSYYIKNRLLKINNKYIKKHKSKKFNKLINKYFLGISESLLSK